MVTAILQNGLSALTAAQRAMNTTSHNIANVNTPGYHAQRTNYVSQVVGGVGAGVSVSGVSRAVDRALQAQQLKTSTALGGATINRAYTDNLSQLFGKPSSGSTIGTAISDLMSKMASFAAATDTVPPSTVVASAQNLATQLNTLSQAIQDERLQADKDVAGDLGQANTLMKQIAQYNGDIGAGQATDQNVADLQDKRDDALRQLSVLVGTSSYVRSDGQMVVMTTDGQTLVDGANANQFGMIGPAPDNTLMEYTEVTTMTATTPTHRIGLGTIGSPSKTGDLTNTLIANGGAVGAELNQRGQYSATGALPQGELQKATAELNQLALALYNTVQATNLGTSDTGANPVYDPANAVNQANHFFSGVYPNPPATPGSIDNAATIQIHPDILANAALLNTTNGAVDISIATNLSNALKSTSIPFAAAGTQPAQTTSLSGYAAAILNGVADRAATAADDESYQAGLLSSIETRLGETTGVNMDEELATLIQQQKAYQAAAKIIQTADEMLDTLLNLKR